MIKVFFKTLKSLLTLIIVFLCFPLIVIINMYKAFKYGNYRINK